MGIGLGAIAAIASILGAVGTGASQYAAHKKQKKLQREARRRLQKEKENQLQRQKSLAEEKKKRVNNSIRSGRYSLLSGGYGGLGLSNPT